LKHESFEACGKVKGNTEKQCDHDYIPPSKNVHGSVSMQSHKEKSLGQSPRSILERWNSSQSQSLPAPASAATVLDKKGNKSKQVRRSSTKVKNAKQAKVERERNEIRTGYNRYKTYKTLGNNLLAKRWSEHLEAALSLQNEYEENRRTMLFNIMLIFSMSTAVSLHGRR
jgi:hypothetical protein